MNPASRVFIYLLGVALTVVLIPWLATFVTALESATTTARGAVANRLQVVGSGITRDISSYLALGVAIDQAVGLDQYLAGELRSEDDIRVALVSSTNGKVLGRFVRPGVVGSVDYSHIDSKANWSVLGLETITFPIAYHGAIVGNVLLAYDTATSVGKVRTMAAKFVAILVIVLAVAFEAVLYAYRETVIVPLRTAISLDQRAANRSFDRIAAPPPGGPAVPLIEAQNRLILAINDRYARVRAYLSEVKELSFNRKAPWAVDKLGRRLARAGQFSPDGLEELHIEHGDLFVGPMAFQGGILIGVAGAIASDAITALGSPWGTASATEAILVGIVAAGILVGWTRGVRVGIGAALAVLGFLLLWVLPGQLLLGGTALVAAGVGIVGTMLATPRPFAAAERVAHAAVGCGVGGVLVTIDSGSGGHWLTYAVAILLLASITLIAGRYGSPPRRLSMPGLPLNLRNPAQLALTLPAWLSWTMIGYWLVAADPASAMIAGTAPGHVGMSLWLIGFLVAAGACVAIYGLRRWKPRSGAEVAMAIGSSALVALTLSGKSLPFAGGSSLLAGLCIGVATTGAAMASRRYTSNLAPPAAIGLTLGVTLALLSRGGDLGNADIFLIAASATVATALIYLANAYRQAGRAAKGTA